MTAKSKQKRIEDLPIRKPRGRPEGSTLLKMCDETLEQIKGLARIQCTQKEAAAVLGVHRETFINFLDTHEKAREAWENGKENGKASLRRYQFKMAEKNPTMAIWLGKNWIDQTDKVESVNVNEDGPSRAAAKERQHERLAELIQRLGSRGTRPLLGAREADEGEEEFSALRDEH